MPWSEDEPLVVPVGHLSGVFVAGGEARREVRVGRALRTLSADQLLVWAAAHSPTDRPAGVAWTRPRVESTAAAAGVRSPSAVLSQLAAAGLVRLVPDAAAAADFARGHRLRPLMLGLGNSEQAPRRFRIGYPAVGVVEVDELLYEVWGAGAGHDTLWAACAAVAGAEHAGQAVLALLANLHALLAVNAAHVDTAYVNTRELIDDRAAVAG